MDKLKTDKNKLEFYKSEFAPDEKILPGHEMTCHAPLDDALLAHTQQARIDKVLAMKPKKFDNEKLIGLTTLQTTAARNQMLRLTQAILRGDDE